jgi:rod shape-determining protein MreD
MRTIYLALPILLLVALLQATIFTRIRVLGGGFDVMLIVVVAWSLVQRGNDGPLWALVGGLFADAFSGGPPGAFTLALTSVALVIALTEGRFYKTNWPVAFIASVLGTLIYQLLYLVVLAIFGHPLNLIDVLALSTFPSAILNLLLMLPTYQAAKWLSAVVSPPKVEIG